MDMQWSYLSVSVSPETRNLKIVLRMHVFKEKSRNHYRHPRTMSVDTIFGRDTVVVEIVYIYPWISIALSV